MKRRARPVYEEHDIHQPICSVKAVWSLVSLDFDSIWFKYEREPNKAKSIVQSVRLNRQAILLINFLHVLHLKVPKKQKTK